MKYFGTDCIRCRCSEYPSNSDFMLKLGWAVGKVFSEQGRSKVLIGKDTRVSGYMFESALQAGLSAAGVDVLLLGPMPTPAVAYLTRTFHAEAGIVISASHNGYQDNAHDGVPSSRSQRRKRVVRKSRSEARGSARSADLCSAVPVGVAASQTEEFGYGFV